MTEIDLSRLSIDRAPGAGKRPRRRRGILIAVAACALAAGGALVGLRSTPEVRSVALTTAYPYQAVTLLNAAGYVVAQRKASVASKATGRLEWLGVVEGTRVKEDEVIARIENRDMRAQVDQARANVEAARAELKEAERALRRAEDLARQNFISAAALDSALARRDKASAALGVAQASQRAAEVAVDQTLIRAPFDGIVLTKTANVGDVITPFSSASESKGAVVTMADMSTLEVEADVSEANLARIAVGMPCEIQLDAFPDKRLRGVVSRLVPTVDRAKATVLVKVRFVLPDPAVLPEMSAKVAFLEREIPDAERQPLLAVHQSALARRDGRDVVFLIDQDRVRMIAVGAGRRIGDLVALEGLAEAALKPGARLVARPPDKLKDGDAVKVAAS